MRLAPNEKTVVDPMSLGGASTALGDGSGSTTIDSPRSRLSSRANSIGDAPHFGLANNNNNNTKSDKNLEDADRKDVFGLYEETRESNNGNNNSQNHLVRKRNSAKSLGSPPQLPSYSLLQKETSGRVAGPLPDSSRKHSTINNLILILTSREPLDFSLQLEAAPGIL